jgi:hypothetical protein
MDIVNNQSPTDTVDESLIEKAELDYWKGLKEDLEALEKDERFQRVILESYFKDFVVNQTSMLSHDYTRREGTRPVLMEQLVAVSTLQDYFRTLKMLGSQLEDEDETEE